MGVKLDLEINDAISDMEEFKQEVQRRAAQWIFERAQELVPVDTGHLQGSGSVNDEGTITYEAAYALIVHEKPGHSHGYKWLERAWKECDVEKIGREVMAEMMMGGL